MWEAGRQAEWAGNQRGRAGTRAGGGGGGGERARQQQTIATPGGPGAAWSASPGEPRARRRARLLRGAARRAPRRGCRPQGRGGARCCMHGWKSWRWCRRCGRPSLQHSPGARASSGRARVPKGWSEGLAGAVLRRVGRAGGETGGAGAPLGRVRGLRRRRRRSRRNGGGGSCAMREIAAARSWLHRWALLACRETGCEGCNRMHTPSQPAPPAVRAIGQHERGTALHRSPQRSPADSSRCASAQRPSLSTGAHQMQTQTTSRPADAARTTAATCAEHPRRRAGAP